MLFLSTYTFIFFFSCCFFNPTSQIIISIVFRIVIQIITDRVKICRCIIIIISNNSMWITIYCCLLSYHISKIMYMNPNYCISSFDVFYYSYWRNGRFNVSLPIRTTVTEVPSSCLSIHLQTAFSPFLLFFQIPPYK